jgi:hypothetical protein
VKDYDPKSNTLLIEYENQWKSDEWFSLDNVRPAAPSFDFSSFAPSAGQQIEAKAKSSDEEPYSWWKASIKTVKGEFYLISYSSWEDEFNEILEKEMLRPLNQSSAYLNGPQIIKQEIPLPKDLRSGLDASHFQPIVQSSQAIAINVQLEPKNTIAIIGSAASVKLSTALLAIALKHLVDIHKLQQRTQQHEASISSLKSKLHDSHMEEFRIKPELMGFVIGKKGANIKRAEEESGAISIRVDSDKGIVVIQAKTAEDAAKARKYLDYIEDSYVIPKNSVGRIVGKNFTNIQEIEKNSGVIRIRVADEKERKNKESNNAELLITGQREAVEMARLLLDHHIKFLDQLSELSEQERLANQKLNELSLDDEAPSSYAGRGGGAMRGRGGRGRGRGRGGFIPRNAEESHRRQPDESDQSQYEESRHPFQRPSKGGEERKSRPQSAFQAARADSALNASQAADEEVKYERKSNNSRQQKGRGQGGEEQKQERKQTEKKEENQQNQQNNQKKERKERQPRKENQEKKVESGEEKKAEGEKKEEKPQSRPQTARNRNQKKPNEQAQSQPASAAAAVAAASAADSAANAAKVSEGEQTKPKDGDGEKKQNNKNRRQGQPNKNKTNETNNENSPNAPAPSASAAAPASSAVQSATQESKSSDNASSQPSGGRRPRRERQAASEVPPTTGEKKEKEEQNQEKKENNQNQKPREKKQKYVPKQPKADSAAAPAPATAQAPAAAEPSKQ